MPKATKAPGPGTIGFIGEGILFSASQCKTSAGLTFVAITKEELGAYMDSLDTVVFVSDCWEIRTLDEVATRCRIGRRPYLPVRVELGTAIVGPTVLPGFPGCLECAALRRNAAREDAGNRAALLRGRSTELSERPSTSITSFAAEFVGTFVAGEVTESSLGGVPRTHRALAVIALDELTVCLRPFLPHPRCSICELLPDDRPESAKLALHARPKASPHVFRLEEPVEIAARLGAPFVNPETGIIRSVKRRAAWGLPVAFAGVGSGDGRTDHGVGCAVDHEASGYAAVLEALERYAGRVPGGKRTGVRAPYTQVRADALDPRRFGLYPPGWYRASGFPYTRFSERRELDWVWGYSFKRDEPVLVPECFAYYQSLRRNGKQRTLAFETSNGCALGSCLEEAILHGLLEIAERDAFLMTWYGQLAVPRVAVPSFGDTSLLFAVRRTEWHTGYEFRAFCTTLEQGIPAIWAVAVDVRPGSGRPALICAGGAHLDPNRAWRSAFKELLTMLATLPDRYVHQRDRVRRMIREPAAVQTMEDHALLYSDPSVSERLGFLLATQDEQERDALFPDTFRSGDLRDDLTHVINKYLATGLDVVVVDQTTPELRSVDLCSVKVLVPGTLPMTFGHRARRTHDLPRLFSVPKLLGFRDSLLRVEDINPHPHPFP